MPSVESTITAKLQQDPSIDYVVTLGAPFALTAVQSAKNAGSNAKIGTFDTNAALVGAIQDGSVQWAVDQQPFLQGYLSIDSLWLYLNNGNVIGGGKETLTGPCVHRQVERRRRRRVREGWNPLMSTSTEVDLAERKVVHDERVKERNRIQRMLIRPEMGALIGAVVIFIFFFVMAPPFRSAESLATVLYGSSTIGIMACAVALLMIGGEFDLSAGVAVTTGSLAASMLAWNFHLNLWAGAGLALILSLAVGFFNGYMVMRTKIPSFLITLGTLLMLTGANIAVTKWVSGAVATPSVNDMQGWESARAVFASTITIFGVAVRVTVLWWLLFTLIATYVLFKTKIGNWIFAVGGDAESARAVGVPVTAVKIGLFMFVGFAAWFSGMHLLFSYNTVQSGQGVGQEFIYIIAAVIGGCLLTGGYGTAIGAAIGAFIFGMVQQGIVYAGWEPDWFKFFMGVMLLFAVIANNAFRNYAAKR